MHKAFKAITITPKHGRLKARRMLTAVIQLTFFFENASSFKTGERHSGLENNSNAKGKREGQTKKGTER